MTQQPPGPMRCSGHEAQWCDAPGCPGMEIKRKVEVFEWLLALLKDAIPYLKVVSRNDLNAYSENSPHLYEEAIAAIAKAEGGG